MSAPGTLLSPRTVVDSIDGSRRADPTLLFALVVFLLACVFDPADSLLGVKVQLFLVCWFIVALHALTAPGTTRVHSGLLVYVLVFLLVPSASIVWYLFWIGGEPFNGFQMLKGYVLVTLALLLHVRRIDLVPHLSAVLTLLALAIIGMSIVLALMPEFLGPLYIAGVSTGIFILDDRDYGGLVLRQVYFVTSPMLAIAIAHYFHRMRTATGRKRWAFAVLTLLCAVAMFVAGTRNNMAVAILLPATLIVLESRRVIESGLLVATALAVFAIVFSEQLLLLLDPTETSNSMKLMLLQDYQRLLSDPVSLFIGRGLGTYDYWETRSAYYFVSELTYLELVRNFGLFGAIVMLALLVFPLVYAFLMEPRYPDRHIIVAYGYYLLMCASNPNLFSSMGILILSIVLANIFVFDSERVSSGGAFV